MPKFSLCIGYYDPEYKKTEIFTNFIKSVVESSKDYDYELVISKDANSYTESYNRAMSNAKGDYLVVLNDDMVIRDKKWLSKLEDPEAITSWRLGANHMHPERLPDAACFCMSRQTFEKLGLIDEEYKDGINYEDTDYFLRAYKLGIPFKKVEINLSHWGYKTTGTYFDERTAEEKKSINRNIFFKRWM